MAFESARLLGSRDYAALRDRLWPTVLGVWAVTALILCLLFARDIATLRLPEPDDAMRLVEVRDWMGGQGWWDVSQHRLAGGAMHWSRLVDLPLAGAIWLLALVCAPETAERIATTLVPLATLLATMALAAALARRMGASARVAVLLVPLSIPILYQMQPLRIDHHGWQVVLALAGPTLLVGRASARAGTLAGLALAALVTISLEGLPIAAAILAVAALAWAYDPRRARVLVALAWSFCLASLALHVATRGPALSAPACDAVSPAWLAMLGVAALALTGATLFGRLRLPVRLSALAAGAIACIVTLRMAACDCLHGPFAMLDPLVYRFWYLSVAEGLPIWRQAPFSAAISIALPVLGLAGSIAAWRAAAGDARQRWAFLLGVLGAAVLLSLIVMRTAATANALAVPGATWALCTLRGRLRWTAGAALAMFGTAAAVSAHGRPAPACTGPADGRALAQLPPSLLFAPIEMTPEILATTRHRGITGPYHRNTAALHGIIAAFAGAPEQAHAIIRASGARYLVACRGLAELDHYRGGLWTRLESGARFDWLTPVPIAGSPVLAWKVIDSSRAPLSRTPARH